MAPNNKDEVIGLTELSVNEAQTLEVLNEYHDNLTQEEHTDNTNISKRQKILWTNVILITAWHVAGAYALITSLFKVKILTFVWGFVVGGIGGFGVTAGVHRLWAHRSYKAKLPLQILLLICYAVAGQNSLLDWVRDHRVHHKFTETDADPHNSRRGFFFSHVGWLLQKKHPEVIRKGQLIDFTDITDDKLLAFYNKYFMYFKIVFCFFLPTIVPPLFWGETWKFAIYSQIFVRYILNLNFTWSVNSFAHIWGYKPYDKRIMPVENIGVSIVAMGEGFHNYHHVFPWDYKAAEFGDYKLNLTTMWLDFFAKIGWAYDMKQPSKKLIDTVIKKHGDGTNGHHEEILYEEAANLEKKLE